VVTSVGKDSVTLEIATTRSVPPPQPRLVVAQALPKGDRGELAVELMTEVGVDAVVPWSAERSITKWQGDRGQRALGKWRATAREAAKQSRRAWIPEVTDTASAQQVGQAISKAACAIVLDPDSAAGLGALPLPQSGDLLLVVGPEGGITEAEGATFRQAGATARSLGPTVLRTSTAGTVAAAILLSRSGRWP
jgi:16S rRNA (uracil1498-N3)-methyltransferase